MAKPKLAKDDGIIQDYKSGTLLAKKRSGKNTGNEELNALMREWLKAAVRNRFLYLTTH